jgi:hypothetical protein
LVGGLVLQRQAPVEEELAAGAQVGGAEGDFVDSENGHGVRSTQAAWQLVIYHFICETEFLC